MLDVVLPARFPDPPGGFIARLAELGPDLEQPAPAGVCLEPGDVPRLALHRREERCVQRVDVDVVALIRASAQPLELGCGLGEPGPEVSDDVADGPVRVTVVAGDEAL